MRRRILQPIVALWLLADGLRTDFSFQNAMDRVVRGALESGALQNGINSLQNSGGGDQQQQVDNSIPDPSALLAPALNMSNSEIASLESSTALAQRQNTGLEKRVQEMHRIVDPMEEHIEALKTSGTLKNSRRKAFLKQLPADSLLGAISALGVNAKLASMVEAPIIFLQPAQLPNLEDLNQRTETGCRTTLHQTQSKTLSFVYLVRTY